MLCDHAQLLAADDGFRIELQVGNRDVIFKKSGYVFHGVGIEELHSEGLQIPKVQFFEEVSFDIPADHFAERR